MNIKIKKTALALAIVCTTSAMAFPVYNEVYCHSTTGIYTEIQFNKISHLFLIQMNGQKASLYATESGNNIVTASDYDQYGNLWRIEVASNSSNWNATMNLFRNNQILANIPMMCNRVGLMPHANAKEAPVSMASLMESIQNIDGETK